MVTTTDVLHHVFGIKFQIFQLFGPSSVDNFRYFLRVPEYCCHFDNGYFEQSCIAVILYEQFIRFASVDAAKCTLGNVTGYPQMCVRGAAFGVRGVDEITNVCVLANIAGAFYFVCVQVIDEQMEWGHIVGHEFGWSNAEKIFDCDDQNVTCRQWWLCMWWR